MIPLQNTELENIYSRSLGAGMQSIAITSSNPGEGVSSLAVALSQRHLLANKSTLFVDLNGDKMDHLPLLTSSEGNNHVATIEPQILTDKEESYALLGIPAPANSKANLYWRNPGILERHLATWLDQFDAVIVDVGSLNRNSQTLIPAERIVGACEATLLVVMAGITTEPTVRHSCDRIHSAGGQLAGCILNECYNPSLKQELLRESNRIPRIFNRLASKITDLIQNNRLLSLEI
jgi:protein-tyrosine kinase